MKKKPRLLLLENVTGLLSTKGGENYKVLHEALNESGYDCGAIVLNADRFVPQSRPRVFVIAVHQGAPIPRELVGNGPCWLHNKAAINLGKLLPNWIWWHTDEPPKRSLGLKDIVETDAPFDKDYVLSLIPPKHQEKLNRMDNIYLTGYRRTRHGHQQLDARGHCRERPCVRGSDT